MSNLYQRSIQIILENQSPNGAFVACPNFPTYQYCWFRDGAYTAYALDLVGQHERAQRFHQWCADRINERAHLVETALSRAARGSAVDLTNLLHTRYTIDGKEGTKQEWPNFQLDGFGTWLWSLWEHCKLVGTGMPDDWLCAANITAAYLNALWNHSCYDCWEEFPDYVHPSTLAAIYGGLNAHAAFSDGRYLNTLGKIKEKILKDYSFEGRFVKFSGKGEVDANLLSLAVPYGVIEPGDLQMRKTVEAIEETLARNGGVHRYAADTYYGGGEWVLLTAWLGWYYTHLSEIGSREKAEMALNWIEAQAGESMELPEQVAENLNDPGYYPVWVERWGSVAKPLLWSHAEYLILKSLIG